MTKPWLSVDSPCQLGFPASSDRSWQPGDIRVSGSSSLRCPSDLPEPSSDRADGPNFKLCGSGCPIERFPRSQIRILLPCRSQACLHHFLGVAWLCETSAQPVKVEA